MKIQNIMEIIGENNREVLDFEGIQVTSKIQFVEILREIYGFEYNSYSIRASVSCEYFSVLFTGGMLSYEPKSESIFIGDNIVDYGNNAKFKVYISHNNWIDIFIDHENKAKTHIILVPKN